MQLTLRINEMTLEQLGKLKNALFTDNYSYVVRLGINALYEKFLSGNILAGIHVKDSGLYSSLAPDISSLPGMDLDVVESHFVRFRKYHPTIEIYRAAIEAVKAEAAAKGEPVKNPEAALYGKLKQWAAGKWKPASGGAVVPPPAGLKSQKEIEKELYGA